MGYIFSYEILEVVLTPPRRGYQKTLGICDPPAQRRDALHANKRSERYQVQAYPPSLHRPELSLLHWPIGTGILVPYGTVRRSMQSSSHNNNNNNPAQ